MTLANSVQHGNTRLEEDLDDRILTGVAGAILYEGATKYRMINADGEVYYNWAGKTGD